MNTTFGFEQIREETIAELNTTARLYRHVATGAEVLSLENDDENKVFGISFRTPPADSTGIAHIMEHAVLGGSRKYPLKEPFVQLLKGSLKTFLNAMTYPDRTIYPVASQNTQDLYNLVDVYLDAVFHPLITRHHLEQEGWHYELDDMDAPLVYKGVVFNEMKGAYSSPDGLLYRQAQRSLFPDNAYGLDSGGDPTVIPDLTYEQFKAFHETFYHPSNALIFFSGDDNPTERLRILDGYLGDFQHLEVDARVTPQPAFDEPRRVTHVYGVDADSELNKKSYVQLNWLLPENVDQTLTMSLALLSHALVSTPASPLRKALLDSELGEDLTGGGLSASLQQMTFGVGLKGINSEDAGRVETLILDTLTQLADEGIDDEMVAASLNTLEFGLRENNTGSYPRGLGLMLRSLQSWLYGHDPLIPLAYETPLAAVKTRLAQEPGYLQSLIRTHLLENAHRTTLLLEPDPEHNRRLEEAEKARLASVRAQMDEASLRAILENTAELRRLQAAPDSPEALAALPMLQLADLDKEIKTIPLALDAWDGSQILYHDLFTNGIVYLDVGFDLHLVPQELLPYVGLFGRALVEIGTESQDFVKLAQRIGQKTGGIHYGSLISAVQDDPAGCAWLLLSGKATLENAQEMLDILADMLMTVKLDNRERFAQILLKMKAGREAGLVPSGHSVVDTRLRAGFSRAGWLSEQIGGVENLFFLRQVQKHMEEDWPAVLHALEALRAILINRAAMLCNVTLDADGWRDFEPRLRSFVGAMPATTPLRPHWTAALPADNEGLTIPAQVNYVGKGANLYELGYVYHGSINVISNYVRTSWLWDKIRAQGGAYGAFCKFARQSGVWTYLSYRDPNLEATLHNYDETATFLRTLDLSNDELTKSIIGAIGAMDGYQLPDAKGYSSMVRHLVGESDAQRQAMRDQVLATTAADFRAFGDLLADVAGAGRVVVLGGSESIQRASQDGVGPLTIRKVL